MTHEQRTLAINAAQQAVKALRKEADILPMSSGSRRWAYISALDAADAALGAAFFSNASDDEVSK